MGEGLNKVMTVFGTRPEAIKFAPVISALSEQPNLQVTNVISSQHTDLLQPFIKLFGIRVDADLDIMQPGHHLNHVLSRVVGALNESMEAFEPDLVLVQGDTTTALAGALAAMNRRIPVGHIEAGLRSGNPSSPFPEEMNRRLIGGIARLHFAATRDNRENLIAEGINPCKIFVPGNPIVDALEHIQAHASPSEEISDLLAQHSGRKLIVVTAHRRENFGGAMGGYFEALKAFVSRTDEYTLLFPVHPNPAVREATQAILGDARNVVLLDPLNYADFVYLLSNAWIIVSDSGGIQEEAPSLGKALLILRRDTERPEAIAAGVSRLVTSATQLTAELVEATHPGSWIEHIRQMANPFGDGHAAPRIAKLVADYLENETRMPETLPRAAATV